MQNTAPIPANEMERLLNLSEFDIDYSNLENNFKDLIHLAAKIAGTEISLINLIDSYTQWSVANHGLDIDQMPREDSVCQYTLLEDDHFEVEDLSIDERFLDKTYVKNPLNLRYYFGIPLKTSQGFNLGALCVMDPKLIKLTPEKVELLRLIANEVLVRLNSIKKTHDLKNQMSEVLENQRKVAHDIRGPLSGIIGLTEIIIDPEENNGIEDILEMVVMINKSSKSVLDLADEILSTKYQSTYFKSDEYNLLIFKEKLQKLYSPQAKNKNIFLSFNINSSTHKTTFKKDSLLQIAGNLISNAIKFTPNYGLVQVNLGLILEDKHHNLSIEVNDSGLGLNEKSIDHILVGTKETTSGTSGENGHGFGLAMVRDLIKLRNGKMHIKSKIGKGTQFEVLIPII